MREMYIHEDVILLVLDGEVVDEPDVDADEGALLIRPTKVIEEIDIYDKGVFSAFDALSRFVRSKCPLADYD